MCTDEHAVEDRNDGNDKVDSVVVRVMKQKGNCTCRVSLNNNSGSYTVQMKKYQELSSSAPLTENCGLAIDVDYPEVKGILRNLSPIECTSGTNNRVIILEKNSVIEMKSRIIGGNFTRGYCMQIYRGYLVNAPEVQINIQCDDPEKTSTISTTHASATTKYKNKQIFTKEITLTTNSKENYKTPTVTTKRHNKEEEITSITYTKENDEKSTVTTKGYNKEEEDDKLKMYIYIGAGAGGVLMIIVFLLTTLCIRLSRPTNKATALTVEQQVCIALRFYASGSFLQVIGDTLGYDKGTVSRVVSDVTDALIDIKDDFVSWPTDVDSINRIKCGFYRQCNFPNVLGCIDCTHVRIQAPSDDEPSYVNRKGYHSINVQAVYDFEGILICILPFRRC
ncbi:HARBI1 [Mytilus coruscus]|uniref:Putative nuclease HARBI1 n=1 Tax=Mytilus coruscus TaxID=42192 RepID=A0A6J8DAV9_MYTCO|nr:HARBI1 [Mytilus coruscus]